MINNEVENPDNHTIGLLLANALDRKLLSDFLRKSGYSVCAPEYAQLEIEKIDYVSAFIIDEALLQQCGNAMLKLKERSEAVFLPVLIASKNNKYNPSLIGRGFDDILHLPIRKQELTSRLSNYLWLREQSQELARQSKAMFRSLVEQSLVGVFVAQEGKQIAYINPAIALILGYREDEVVDRLDFIDLIHPEDCQKVSGYIWGQIIGESDGVQFECRCLCKDGSPVYCEIFMRKIAYKNQPAILGTLVNINQRKNTQKELIKHQEHLEELIKERTERLEFLVKAMSGREIRMAELKKVITKLRTQLKEAGMTPAAFDPLLGPDKEW